MKRYVVGVDVGGTHTKLALLDLRGRILAKDSFLTRAYKKEEIVKAISDASAGLIAKRGLKKKDILGIGIGVPGLVDFKKGLVFYFVNIPAWKDVPLKKKIEKATGLTTFVDNDVKVMALGEIAYGAGKGRSNVICMTLGTGVGGALIIDGKMRRGASLVAGEIGHIPINENGARCNCGGAGCLEAYVGREYFLDNIRRELKSGAKSLVRVMVKNRLSRIQPEIMMDAALKGDAFAKRKWEEMGTHIGSALVGVVNFINPGIIIIGGGIAEAERFIFGAIRKTIAKRAMKVQGKAVKVLKAKLGNDAGVIGAAEMVKRSLQ
ncbi:MAG: ROK family protein [Candidatus Omnitrophica bacterium]|nr:ROK family protein [Candidatus Omnitrophota bacterium]